MNVPFPAKWNDGYTAAVLSLYRDLLFVYFAISIVLIVAYGYIAATASDGPRKERAIFIATLSFASWFIVGPIATSLYESRLPVYEFSGVIDSVRVLDSSSKYYSAWLRIATTAGGEITVHVSEREDAWVPGQPLRIRYYGQTGDLIRATLLDADGKQTGIVDSTAGFSRDLLVLVGLFLCWVAWKRYRRDPQGTEEGDAPDNLPQQSPLGLDEEPLSRYERDQIKESARRSLAKANQRTLTAGGASLIGCALVYLVSEGHSLHRYWESVGLPTVVFAFISLVAFTICGMVSLTSRMGIRRMEKDQDETS